MDILTIAFAMVAISLSLLSLFLGAINCQNNAQYEARIVKLEKFEHLIESQLKQQGSEQ